MLYSGLLVPNNQKTPDLISGGGGNHFGLWHQEVELPTVVIPCEQGSNQK